MAFSEQLRRKAREVNDCCEACREILPLDAAYDLHSATSLHLVRIDTPSGSKFLVTSPPRGHQVLKGKTIDLRIWPFDTETDGVFLCVLCHDEIRRIALVQAKIDGFAGSAPPPQILAEVTAFAIQRGKPLSFDLFE